MKKGLIIIMVVVLCLGIVLVGTALIITKGNLTALGNDEREACRIDETEEATSLTIDIASDNIKLVVSEDEKLHIDYYTSTKMPYTYSYENGKASLISRNKIHLFSIFNYNKPKDIIVYVPNSLTENVVIKGASSDFVSNIGLNIKRFTLDISSGNCTVSKIIANNIDIESSSGQVTVTDCSAERADFGLSSGNIKIIGCEIADARIDVSSGNVTLKNSTITELNINISSGNISTERLVSTEIRTNNSSGNATFNLVGKSTDYTISLKTSSGSLHLLSASENISISTQSSLDSGSGAGVINCKCSSGNVHVNFID